MAPSKFWVRLVAALTPDCNVVTQLVSESRERPLTALERLRLRLHYRICQWCRRYREHLEEIGVAAKKAASPSAKSRQRTLSPECKAKLRDRMDHHSKPQRRNERDGG